MPEASSLETSLSLGSVQVPKRLPVKANKNPAARRGAGQTFTPPDIANNIFHVPVVAADATSGPVGLRPIRSASDHRLPRRAAPRPARRPGPSR
jgi:hypothetical protein